MNDFNIDNNNEDNNNSPYTQYGFYTRTPNQIFVSAAYAMGILAIISTILITVYLPFIFGGLSIIFAMLSRTDLEKLQQKAKKGMICGIIGISMNVALIVTCFTLVFTKPEMRTELNTVCEQMYGISFDELLEEMYGGGSL